MSAQLIKNGRLVMETRVIDGGAVLIEDGKIARIYDKTPNLSGERLNVIDAGGLYVSPGFIDVHVHGGGGYDFLCGDEDNVLSACRTHLKHGTTAIMATISTADNPAFLKAMSAIEFRCKKDQSAGRRAYRRPVLRDEPARRAVAPLHTQPRSQGVYGNRRTLPDGQALGGCA